MAGALGAICDGIETATLDATPVLRKMIRPLDDAEAVALAAADRFLAAALEAVQERGRFVVVLSGGSTPSRMYRKLASDPLRSRIPWGQTVVLFGDERHVGPNDEQSNYRTAREALLDRVPIPPDRVHRMRGELEDAEASSAAYESILHGLFPDAHAPRFDLLLLGIGEDGHTASLFPGTEALEESSRWVAANHVPKLDGWRITLTFPALCAAREICFVITGENKARVVAEAFGGLPHPTVHPCERVVPVEGHRVILVDREAASQL